MPPSVRRLVSAANHLQSFRSKHCSRPSSSLSPSARLNHPVDYGTTPVLNHTSKSALLNPELPADVRNGRTARQNLFQAINSALQTALARDASVLLFGEDVSFGGVFRCSMNLQSEFGADRVFNTPLSEQGIAGFAIGCAMEGMKPVAEIQFADYVYPAFDQLVNEAAKLRYRAGANGDEQSCGGLTSPESLFTHIPGLRVVMPRSPLQAKGLLLASIFSPDPVVFFEPKILYRAAVEQVPTDFYTLPLSKAEVIKGGKDVTIISYGAPLYTCSAAMEKAEKDIGCSVELIDLRTLYPWDRKTIMQSVNKTGRAIVVHESMVNAGVGAEIAATVQEHCFLRLEAPVQRVAGWSTHAGLVYERFNIPDVARVYDAIKASLHY
ncbi:hypothetical protein B0A49_00374 [Cryomyces minteri]|uniref:3-methyl-2-oxobutanoate dehydrogenase (2-methylpropanoyl-transferring) n=1 Tax=Cryomyces minteri TaxID=331657 RepID=A0A4U0Y0M1_9PEZI|nr:hypothetical protein B0A49_00374 [Cryomyces minteri]